MAFNVLYSSKGILMAKKIHIQKANHGPPITRNPVAKAMHKIQKCVAHKDRKNDYQRHPKHRKSWGDAFSSGAYS